MFIVQTVIIMTMIQALDVITQTDGIPCFFMDWCMWRKVANHTFRNACLLNIFCMAQKNRITMSDLILEEKTKIFDKHWCLHSIDSRYRCVNVSRFCNVLVVTSMDDFTKLANT